MSTPRRDSTGAALRRPRSWAALGAILMAVITTLVAVRAQAAIPEPPRFEVTVLIEGSHEWNISQETVDAVLAEPIKSTRPLRLTLTDRYLTGDELLRGELEHDDVLLSAQQENLNPEAPSATPERFAGASVKSDYFDDGQAATDARFEISDAFWDNVSLGHGPQAVRAAALRAAALLDEAPVQNPVYWFGAIGFCAMLTAALLLIALRERARWDSRHRRLKTAQRKLARVLLDLQALEATYLASAGNARPDGFAKNWDQLQSLSLQAARDEAPLVSALFAKDSALSQDTGQKLAAFEAASRKLTGLADALMGAGSVHANLAERGTTFDKLSGPINDAATALLIRLDRAPGTMVSGEELGRVRKDVGELLDACAGDVDSADGVARWKSAERELATNIRALRKRLRRYPHGKIPAVAPGSAQHRQLRESLGLQAPEESSALHQLAQANALARAILGDTLASDRRPARMGSRGAALARIAGWLRTSTPGAGDEPRPRRLALAISAAVLALIGSMIGAGLIVSAMTGRPEVAQGTGQGVSFEIDDATGQVDEEAIVKYMDTDFDSDHRFTIAVRDAESYLDFLPLATGSSVRAVAPGSILESKWRIKHEFRDKLDPLTDELAPGEAIVPVLVTDAQKTIIPGILTSEVAAGQYSWGSLVDWEHGSIYESRYLDMEIAGTLDDYNEALARNGIEKAGFSAAALFWMLSLMFFFTLLNAVLIMRYLLGATTRIGRFGRGAGELARARKKLESLMLGLDEAQINAVAVLGAGTGGSADEAGQRLFERALVMAWHEAQELAALPLSQRWQPGYAGRVAHLDRLVALLGERDADVARRAQALVTATRGAGGDRPVSARLPG